MNQTPNHSFIDLTGENVTLCYLGMQGISTSIFLDQAENKRTIVGNAVKYKRDVSGYLGLMGWIGKLLERRICKCTVQVSPKCTCLKLSGYHKP